MTFTYKFFHKAEDAEPIDIADFQGETEKAVKDEVIEYCDTYGYEAYILVPSKPQVTKKVWGEDEIRDLIQTNDKVLYGALKKLYACQTADERYAGQTRQKNGAGFNSVDAPILSSFCEFLKRTGFLTDKQKYIARKKLVKYNRQLTAIANA